VLVVVGENVFFLPCVNEFVDSSRPRYGDASAPVFPAEMPLARNFRRIGKTPTPLPLCRNGNRPQERYMAFSVFLGQIVLHRTLLPLVTAPASSPAPMAALIASVAVASSNFLAWESFP